MHSEQFDEKIQGPILVNDMQKPPPPLLSPKWRTASLFTTLIELPVI